MAVYNKEDTLPAIVKENLLVKSKDMPANSQKVVGYDFNDGIDYHKLLQSYAISGFQATNFGLAVQEINKMLDKKAEPRLSMKAPGDAPGRVYHPRERRDTNCTIFLGFTSNLISSGIRETVRFLVQHNLVDVLVTTGGGIEEDLIKCMGDTYVGDFHLKGRDLRAKGHNRIGNLVAPNENYIKFEKWIPAIFDRMLLEQNDQGINWTPSKLIERLGREINNPESVCYWAYKNNIPVFSPAITDGAIGDELYFHSYSNPGLRLDIIEDVRAMDNMAVFAAHSGMIILGGGLVKHHICNANLMRNGADYSVYINTAQEFDGSDAGARPDEAVSWGKIKLEASPVKIFSEFTLVFPLIVAETFARRVPLPSKQVNGALDNKEANGHDQGTTKSGMELQR